MKKSFFIINTLCFILLVCFFSSRSSAVMKALSTEELTRASSMVIRGEVLDVDAHWGQGSRTIYTSATIIITDTIKGNGTQKKIKVRYKGGEIGNIGLKVSDTSRFIKGEKVLLFLKSEEIVKGKVISYKMTGKAQGKYTIDKDNIARKEGFSLAGDDKNIDNNIPVKALIDKIKKVK